MAKRKRTLTAEEQQRQSRKQVLIARKQARQTRQIRLAISGVVVLLVLVFAVAIVNEFFIAPNRAVATVGDVTISLAKWQDRVRYERAQRILFLESQLESFGDIGIIQQFAGQMIIDLQDAESMGQNTLDLMVEEEAIRQLAAARGITISDAELEEEIEKGFNYFGGESPTQVPSPTATIMPTPSLTPYPTAVITEVLPTVTPFPTPTTGPTRTPLPTPTAVSFEAFQEQFAEVLDQFKAMGVDEATYQTAQEGRLLRIRLSDALAEEVGMPTEAPHASLFLLTLDTEEDANTARARLAEEGFLTVWNKARSGASAPEFVGRASEALWRTQDSLASSFGEELAQVAFDIDVGQTSDVIMREIGEDSTVYYVFQVSGRENRPLALSTLDQDKAVLLTSFVDQLLAGNLESSEFWRGRSPSQPVLDPIFLTPPTPTPVLFVPEGENEGSDAQPTSEGAAQDGG